MDMALYLSEGIEENRLNYNEVFANPKLLKIKDNVDTILTDDGFQDKIVPVA